MLKVEELNVFSNHSFILSLLAGIRGSGRKLERSDTAGTARTGHEQRDSDDCKQPVFSALDCLMWGLLIIASDGSICCTNTREVRRHDLHAGIRSLSLKPDAMNSLYDQRHD